MIPKILSALLAGTSLAMGLTIVATSLVAIYESHVVGPIGDFWNFIPMLEALDRGESLLPWLFQPYGGGHRLVVPKLFYLAEYRFFHGKNVFLICASVLTLSVSVVILLRAVQREQRRLLLTERIFAVGFILALTLSATQYSNFVRAWNLHWYLCITGMIASIASLVRTHARARRGDALGAWSWWTATIACALVANYSMANGLVIWPSLLVVGFVMRLAPRFMAGVAIVGATSIRLFGITQGPTGGVIERLGDIALWILKCLGGPASWSHESAGVALAASGILAGCALVARLSRRRSEALPSECLLLGVMGISLGSVAMVAVGRLNYPWDFDRYQTIVLLFWLSLVLLALLALSDSGARSEGDAPSNPRPANVGVMLLSTLWLAGLLFPTHLDSTQKMRQVSRRARIANTAILMGAQDRNSYRFVLPHSNRKLDRDITVAYRPFLEEHKLGSFADGLHELLARSMSDVYPDTQAGCLGGVKRPIQEWSHPQRMAPVQGWVKARAGTKLEEYLVMAKPDGTIVGLARALDRRFDPFGGSREAASPFRGFAQVASNSLDVFAITKSGSACPIARDVPLQLRDDPVPSTLERIGEPGRSRVERRLPEPSSPVVFSPLHTLKRKQMLPTDGPTETS